MASQRPDLPCAGPMPAPARKTYAGRYVLDVSNPDSGPCRVITSEPCKEFPDIDALESDSQAEADRAIESRPEPSA